MFAALVVSIHKTELPGDQVLEVVTACCLPQLLGQTAAVDNKIRINFHDMGHRFFLYNQKRNFSLIRQKTKKFPIDPNYKNHMLL